MVRYCMANTEVTRQTMKAFSLRTENKAAYFLPVQLITKLTLCAVGLCAEVSYISKSSHAITCKAWLTSHTDSRLMKLLEPMWEAYGKCAILRKILRKECMTFI